MEIDDPTRKALSARVIDLLCDHLLMQAERGEITKEQAEAAAAAHGLEPFERRPELPRFDPKFKSHWSIVMSVAWIARRDFELVREQDPEFCSECFHWIYRERKGPPDKTAEPVKRGGYFLETKLAPTVSRLALLDVVSRVRGNVPSTAAMTIREAQAVLWRALSEGHLMANGFNTEGVLVEIPSREWAYLRLREEGERDVLRYDAISRPEPYTTVKLEQSELLRLWPATGESPALPATAINKGGRPPEYDWDAIETFALQKIKELGRPHSSRRLPSKAQLIELIKAEWARRSDREPPTSSLKTHLNRWLAKMDGN